MGVVGVQNANLEKAEKIIEDYLEKHPGSNFATEIADTFGLDYSIVFKAIHKLLEEGRIRKAKDDLNRRGDGS